MGGVGIVILSERGTEIGEGTAGTGLDRENVRRGRVGKTLVDVADDEDVLCVYQF